MAATTGTVDLSITQVGSTGFNDYGIDMISFRPCGVIPEIALYDTTICTFEDLVLNPVITGGSGNYSCSWSPTGNLNNASICMPTFNAGATGAYPLTLTVTDNVSGCMATATVTITVIECCTPVSTTCNACPNACTGPGSELVTNGDFANGNTGFTSGLSVSCVCALQSYCVAPNALNKCAITGWQSVFAPDCNNFMIVDAFGAVNIWQQAGIPVTGGKTYNFSFSLYRDVTGNGGPTLDLRINGSPVLTGITGTSGMWTNHCVSYLAPSTTTVTLSLDQTASVGNCDYGVDVISFSECGADPMAAIAPVADFCENENAVLNTIITGGTGTPTCLWSPTTGLSSSTDCTPTVSGLSAGSHTYTVTVTDPSMCTATASVSFDVNENPTVNGILFNQVCEGDDLNLGVSATPTPTGYLWDGPDNFNSTSPNPTITNVTGVNGGLYSVTVTSADGCTGTASQNIPVNFNNGFMILSYNAPVCHLGTLNLMVTGPPMSYSWTGPDNFSSTLQNPSIPNVTQNVNGGDYYLTVTDGNGCTREWSLNVTIEPSPSILALSNTPVCDGQPLTVYEAGGDAVSWNWSGPAGFGGSNQVETIANATSANDGLYWVTITDADGCTQVAVTNVTVFDSLDIEMPDTTLCEWDFYQFNPVISNGSGNYTCSYSPSGNLNTPNICNPTFQSGTDGTFTYTLTVTDNGTGCTATKTFTITVDDCCTPVVTSCNACMTACQGSELVVDGDFNSLPGNANVGSSLPAINGCVPGSYWITGNARSKCNYPLWNSVNAPDCGNFMVTDGNNGTIWSQTVNVTAGSTYNFGFDFYPDLSGGTSPTLQMRVATTPILSGITAPLGTWTGICGSYTATTTGNVLLEIRQTANGVWSDYGIDNVTFMECLSGPEVTTIPDTLICETDCIVLSTSVTNATGGYTCSWSPSTNLNDPNLCSPTVCYLSSGVHTYIVTVIDSVGCVGRDTVHISVKSQPTAIAVSNSPICEGDDIQLNEIGGNSVSWSWTGPNSFISNLQSPVVPNAMNGTHDGTYTVIVENTAGCKDTATTTVVIHPPLSISGLVDSTVCEGEPIALNPIVGGGSGNYSCSWSPSPNLNNASSCTPTFNAVNAGVYTFTLTVTDNATGCMATATATMTAEICCTPTQTGCSACSSFCGSTELVVNGDFGSGDTGFNSGLPSNCGCVPNSYCVDDNALDKCTNSGWKPIRSSDCIGDYMIVDGFVGVIWEQTVTVTSGNTYFFGFDFYPNVSDGASPVLEMEVDGSPLLSNITGPLDTWTSHCASWTAMSFQQYNHSDQSDLPCF